MAGFDIATAGEAAVGDVLGAGMGLATQGFTNQQQLLQQQKLQNQQITGQEELMRYQQGLQLDMWNKTNYSAQMEQLAKAGLNPALLYGKGGGMGATTGGGMPSVSGGQASSNNSAMQGMGIMAQQAAQIELLKAQTRNIDADTANKPKVGENIEASTGNIKADTILKKIEGEVQGATIEEQIMTITNVATQAMNAAMQSDIQTNVDRATMNKHIDIIFQQAIEAQLRNASLKSGIEVNQAQINKMSQDIAQGWTGLDNNAKQIKLNAWIAEQEKSNPSIWNVIGGAMKSGVHKLAEALGQKPDDSGFKPPIK